MITIRAKRGKKVIVNMIGWLEPVEIKGPGEQTFDLPENRRGVTLEITEVDAKAP